MPGIASLSEVGIFVRDQKAARAFYTRTLGLKVREDWKAMGYLALGSTIGGGDASLNLWQPSMWKHTAEERSHIGEVTGIVFRCRNVPKTVEVLRRKGAKVRVSAEGGGHWAEVKDPDGNSFVLHNPQSRAAGRAGVGSLDFVMVACRDAAKAGRFYEGVLGMRRERGMASYGIRYFRLRRGGTALAPFTPRRSWYDSKADFESDRAHIGESTYISFSASGLPALAKRWSKRGVRFKTKPEKTDWGALRAHFYDPSRNVFSVYEMLE